MREKKLYVLILAAGRGTRMRSVLPKILHPLGGRPVFQHVLETAQALSPEEIILLISPEYKNHFDRFVFPQCLKVAFQDSPFGTGHAALLGLKSLEAFKNEKLSGDLLILFGDTPLITAETLKKMRHHKEKNPEAAAIVLGMCPEESTGYARLIMTSDGRVTDIIEYREATAEILKNPLCNSGVMLLDGEKAGELLGQLTHTNQAKEYYLTQLIGLADAKGWPCLAVEGESEEFYGINTREDLAFCEKIFQKRQRRRMLSEGVTLHDPESVYFSWDTVLSSDVTVYPHVFFGPGVRVEEQATVFSFCHIEGAHIGRGAKVGPFAYLRQGTVLKEKVHIGNFVEVKNAVFLSGAKAKHLSYVGDAHVGEKANIGAGTVFCNYDGQLKHQTLIGDGAFVGSNSTLVAPLTIGDEAFIGAGSTITKNVPSQDLSIGRAQQKNMAGRGVRYRKNLSKS